MRNLFVGVVTALGQKLEHLNPTWDLDAIFPGGSESPEFAAYLENLEGDIAGFGRQIKEWQVPQTPAEARNWAGLLGLLQDLSKRLRQGYAFVSCLNAQNVKDQTARQLSGRMSQIGAAFASAVTLLDSQILQMEQAAFEGILSDERFAEVRYPLEERRRRAQEKFPPAMESLTNDLTVDGYHGWGDMYNAIVSRIAIPFEVDGKPVNLSVGQTANRMSSGDRAVRADASAKWEEAWQKEADLIATTLNHLAGYRLNLYKHRGWDSVLKEPLENNRMTEETLHVMWETIEQNKHHFVAFLSRKARLMGLERLEWHDVAAPLTAKVRKVTYDEAATFIVEQFHKFNPDMATFAARNFTGRWIEAEDRPGKRPGGFCTSFPVARQSRIFMTFAGNVGNVATLAHELGHAYHQHVMNDLPQLAQGYAMNVAETASTFAELIVDDAALKAATDEDEKIAMLADKSERAIAFFMNIHARFRFETRFYERRKKGMLTVDQLNELMTSAQKEAYKDALASYHPTFWASKLHFYSTGQPFYNYPYTFGYLFSGGVYARALAEGPGFAAKYVDLLRDTGRMRVEDLAAKHLGVDLTRPEFWQSAVDLSVRDVQAFMELTK